MDDGQIDDRGDRIAFHYRRHVPHPVDSVWSAITDRERNSAWFGGSVEIDPRVGGAFISHHRGDLRVVDRVVRIEAPVLLEHTFWEEVNPSALVTWRLEPAAEGCVLELSHSLARTEIERVAVRSGDTPAVIIARNAAGWHHLLDGLAAVLAGDPLDWSPVEQQALQAHYASVLANSATEQV